jgi:hypothetical protein
MITLLSVRILLKYENVAFITFAKASKIFYTKHVLNPMSLIISVKTKRTYAYRNAFRINNTGFRRAGWCSGNDLELYY